MLKYKPNFGFLINSVVLDVYRIKNIFTNDINNLQYVLVDNLLYNTDLQSQTSQKFLTAQLDYPLITFITIPSNIVINKLILVFRQIKLTMTYTYLNYLGNTLRYINAFDYDTYLEHTETLTQFEVAIAYDNENYTEDILIDNATLSLYVQTKPKLPKFLYKEEVQNE